MATTDFSQASLAGVNFNRRTTTKEFSLGTVVNGTTNTIWIYVLAAEVVATRTCTVNASTFDLSVMNPNGGEVVAHRSPQDIMDEIAALDAEAAEVLATIRGLL